LGISIKLEVDIAYSYKSQTHDQMHFTILEVAADWHELMIPQCTMRPSIARLSEQLDPRFAASRHTTVLPIYDRTIVTSQSLQYTFIERRCVLK